MKAFLHRPIGPCKTETKQNHDEIKMSSSFLITPGLYVRLFRHKVHPPLRCIDDFFFLLSLFRSFHCWHFSNEKWKQTWRLSLHVLLTAWQPWPWQRETAADSQYQSSEALLCLCSLTWIWSLLFSPIHLDLTGTHQQIVSGSWLCLLPRKKKAWNHLCF